MRVFIIGLLALTISACAGTDAIRRGIAERGSDLSDRAVEDAVFILCRAAPIGAINRRFAQDREKAQAYAILCRDMQSQNIITESGPNTD